MNVFGGTRMKMMKGALIVAASLSVFALSCQSTPTEKKADAAAAPAAPAGKTAEVTKGTPVIDGIMDDLYAVSEVLVTDTKTEGETDVYAEARLLWDENFLYAFIDVKDPVLSDKNGNAWEQDSIEVVIDQNNAKSRSYQLDDAQYRVNFKGVVSFGTNANTKDFKSVAVITETGYVVEVAIPLHKVPGAAGNSVGFDVQVNEDNGRGSRTAIRCWSDKTNTNYLSTANYGTLTLK